MSEQHAGKSPEEQAAEAVDNLGAPQVQQAEIVEPKEAPKEQHAVATRPADIAVKDGLLEPHSLTEMTRIADGLMKAGCLPKQLNSVPKVLMAMQFLRQLGLPDIACLPRLCIINGSYSLWGEGPKAICQPEIEDFEEFLFDKDYNRICFANKNLNADAFGALCRVKRKGIPTWVERAFTEPDAKKAGLLGKSGPWQEYRPRMYQMRARSWALKDGFADKLMGLGIAEYDHHQLPEAIDVSDGNQAPKLVERFQDSPRQDAPPVSQGG